MTKRLSRWLMAVEAAAGLCLASVLIRTVRLRWWRGSLGRVDTSDIDIVDTPKDPQVLQVVAAVESACHRLPLAFNCLPRAIATQWMLKRRRIDSELVFGALADNSSGKLWDLHAWVEINGEIVIGDTVDRRYAPTLRLRQSF